MNSIERHNTTRPSDDNDNKSISLLWRCLLGGLVAGVSGRYTYPIHSYSYSGTDDIHTVRGVAPRHAWLR